MSQFVTLKIGESSGGQAKKLQALRSTADYYGWSEEFEEWTFEPEFEQGGRSYGRDPGRKGRRASSAGYSVRISRTPVTHGLPAGFVNRFKVTSNTGLFDLAELGHFTKVDWYWMESPRSGRVLRAEWEARYLARV